MAITKQMNINKRAYYFYNDLLKLFDLLIYKIDEFIEEKRRNKYLNIAFTDNNDESLTKYK